MHVLTRPLATGAQVALPGSITGDAMADLVEFAELFDIDMDQFTRVLALRIARCEACAPLFSACWLRLRCPVARANPVKQACATAPSKGNVINLMEALKASIKTAGKSEPTAVAKPSKPAKKTAKPKRKAG